MLYLSNFAASNPVESEKAVENQEWRAVNEPRLATLEAESATRSSHIEELEAEKRRMEVEVAALKESLTKFKELSCGRMISSIGRKDFYEMIGEQGRGIVLLKEELGIII